MHTAECALTLEDCIRLYVCECHNDVSPLSALRYTRVLQRVSEPRHSKAITVMFYTRHCSQLHRHSARSRIIFYEDVRACCKTFSCKKIRKETCTRTEARKPRYRFYTQKNNLAIVAKFQWLNQISSNSHCLSIHS